MTYCNKTKLDAGTACLFSMFERAWSPTLGKLESPDKLYREHKMLVVGTCRTLEWRGLVEPDRKLVFGCTPTERLERMFAKQRAHPLKYRMKARASVEDTDVLNSIFDAAVPDEDHPYVCPLARISLHVLGLVMYSHSEGGEVVPTQELRQLAAERREEERNLRWVKSSQKYLKFQHQPMCVN
jgi:hypothetical protein